MNNVLESFPVVPFFKFDEYSGRKSEAVTFVKIRPAYLILNTISHYIISNFQLILINFIFR